MLLLGGVCLAILLFFVQTSKPNETLGVQAIRAIVKATVVTVALWILFGIGKILFGLGCLAAVIYLAFVIFAKKKPLITPPPTRR